MFYLSFILALLVSISSTFFCVVSGAGVVLDLLGACSVILLVIGTSLSPSALKQGSILSMVGVGACALVVLVSIAELIHAIPLDSNQDRCHSSTFRSSSLVYLYCTSPLFGAG